MQRSRLVIVRDEATEPSQGFVGNLPAPPTTLLGREQEAARARHLLESDDVRLLTMTGPGGVGKTRLALRVASDLEAGLPDGAYFVSLAPADRPDLVIAAIAQALEVKEAANTSLLQTLKDHLHYMHALLVLDNFEQVVDASPLVSELMSAAPLLKVLVTSRVVLHLRGEYEFPVLPLSLPAGSHMGLEELSRSPAVALFAQRAAAVKPGFEITVDNAATVVDICARLDGLPLAIELAAARAKLLDTRAILARLDNRLRALTGGARDLPARQQTLRSTLDWSYDLLDPDEQLLFRRLAVFAGGCTLEAAEAVAGSPGQAMDILESLGSLVDKSLLRPGDGVDGEPRFRMLETIREYALERLEESPEAGDIRLAHAAYFLSLLEAAGEELGGPEQAAWFTRLEAEHDNFRAALRRSLENGEIVTALRMEGVLWRFWEVRGHISEGLRWIEETLQSGGPAPGDVRAAALHGGSRLAWLQGNYALTQQWAEEGLRLWEAVGSKQGRARALHILGIVAGHLGDDARAEAYYEESMAVWRELGDKGNLARLLNSLGVMARTRGDYGRARSYFAEGLALSKELGNKRSISTLLGNLGYLAHRERDYETARSLFAESLALRVEVNHTLGMVESLVGLAGVAGSLGQAARAVRLFAAVDVLCEITGYTMDPDDRVEYSRNLELARGQLDEAAFNAAWAEGQALTLERAVEEALAPMSEAVPLANHTTEGPGPERLAGPLLGPQPSTSIAPLPPLSRAEFAGATQELLRNYSRPYLLQDNPLLRSRLVVERSGPGANASQRTVALQALVREALETIKASPHDVKLYRAVYHTYIQPAPTQEQASELLDIPYSTFRRHLKAGISRVTEILAQWEMQALDS